MTKTAYLLDKAMRLNHLKSDYKLALVMGVSQSTIANYRTGKTVPESHIVAKICELTDDDSALIAVEFEAAKAKTPESRRIWETVYKRMQAGFANVEMLALIAIISIAAYALPVGAMAAFGTQSADSSLYIMLSAVCRLAYKCTVHFWVFVKFCKVQQYVPRFTHTAA